MVEVLGPSTDSLLRLLAAIPELTSDDVEAVAATAREISLQQRAVAWARILEGSSPDQRIQVLRAARVARRSALAVWQGGGRRDRAFWMAASDAAVALAASGTADRAARQLLVAAMATRMPWLRDQADSRTIPQQRSGPTEGAPDEPAAPTRGRRRR